MGLGSARGVTWRARRSSDPVSDLPPGGNSLAWRVTVLEREVERLKAGQPDVVAERVGMLSLRLSELKTEIEKDMAALAEQIRAGDDAQSKQIKDFRRIFVSVFSALGVTVAASVVALLITGGAP